MVCCYETAFKVLKELKRVCAAYRPTAPYIQGLIQGILIDSDCLLLIDYPWKDVASTQGITYYSKTGLESPARSRYNVLQPTELLKPLMCS